MEKIAAKTNTFRKYGDENGEISRTTMYILKKNEENIDLGSYQLAIQLLTYLYLLLKYIRLIICYIL